MEIRRSPRKLPRQSPRGSEIDLRLTNSRHSSTTPKKTRLDNGSTPEVKNKPSSTTGRLHTTNCRTSTSPKKRRLKVGQSTTVNSDDSNSESLSETTDTDNDCINKTVSSLPTAHTPYELRLKIRSRLKKMAVDDGQSDSEDTDWKTSSSSSEDDTEVEGTVVDNKRGNNESKKDNPVKSQKVAAPASLSTNQTISTQRRAEEYFLAQKSHVNTSNNTMSRIEVPRFDYETTKHIIKKATRSHEDHLNALMAKYRKNFPKWIFQLSQGFNLLLHGVGSKISLLQEFREFAMDEFTVLIVNGFFPNITIKQILNSITGEILDSKREFSKPEDQVAFIHTTLEESDIGEVLIIINSIDGVMLRPERTQNILCSLAKGKHVHMIASIDHINAPLLWDQAKMCGFNWLWHDTTTFLPYLEEMSYENSFFSQQTGRLALSSLLHVFNSLTPNAKGIFLLLARYQLKNKENSTNYLGMAFQDCYQQCRESFLVNSELTLKAQLTEFKDHKLLKVKQGSEGSDHLLIPLDTSTISEFLAQVEST